MCARLVPAGQQGVTEEMIADVCGDKWRTSNQLTPAEKAAIHFAEVFGGDHHSTNRALFDELRQHFTDSDIMDLGMRMLIVTGWVRLLIVLGVRM